jgi:hypothetical protein
VVVDCPGCGQSPCAETRRRETGVERMPKTTSWR